MSKNNKKVINAWALYDWANSVYPLVIISTIFPIYYLNIAKNGNSDVVAFLGMHLKNGALYSYALSFSYLIIAVLSPGLSGIADYSGSKKRFMKFFCTLGSLACALLFFFTSVKALNWGIIAFVLAGVGYSGSIVFYNAYLPEIADPENQDRVSAKGYAMGYIGSSLLLIFNLTMVLKPEWYGGISKSLASRIAFLSAGVWWWCFAQYTFYHLPKPKKNNAKKKNVVLKGYQELVKVWRQLKHTPALKRFLAAFFFYSMGVQTVMFVATLFGKKELQLTSGQLITTILIIQFVAVGGAYLFSFLSAKKGNINTLLIAILIWIGVCIGAYFVYHAMGFYILATVVGIIMGGIQSLSRSTYSKLLPETEDHASYFSFYDVCEKVGIVLGTASYGFIEQMTGSMRNSVITLAIYFIVGLLFLTRVRKVQA